MHKIQTKVSSTATSKSVEKKESIPKVVSLFCGAGGLDLGFINAGFDILAAFDNNQAAVQTYRSNLGDHASKRDVRDVKLEMRCDVVIGGPPCQGFSVAGKMDPKDPRSKLVSEFLRVVEELRPKMWVMENVEHLANSPKFAGVRDLIHTKAKELGYDLNVWKLNAKDYGVPQSRERVFFIGRISSLRKPEIPTQMQSVTAGEALRRLHNTDMTSDMGRCSAKIVPAKNPILRASPYSGMLFNGQGRPIRLSGVANTLPASMGGNRTPIIDELVLREEVKEEDSWLAHYHAHRMTGGDGTGWDVPDHLRRITVSEASALQGFPQDFSFCGKLSLQYRQIGNSVPPPLAKAVAQSVMASLNI